MRDWIEEARAAGLAQPASCAFATVGAGDAPSSRTVNLKRIEPDALVFAERDPGHQLQTVVSRQGERIDDLKPLRDRLAHLAAVQETPPRCPDDWGALRVTPHAVELWQESPDRLHERRLCERNGEGWRVTLLAP